MNFKIGDKVSFKEQEQGYPNALEITAIYYDKDVVMLKGIDKSWEGGTSISSIEKFSNKKLKPSKRARINHKQELKDEQEPITKKKKKKEPNYYWP